MRNPRLARSLRLPPSSIARAPLPSRPAWSSPKSALQLPPHTQYRHFLPGLAPEIQSLHATRTLPYSSAALYDIVADINSYSAFLPYCLGSSVSEWTPAAARNGKRWPAEAELRIGWGGLDESFVSRVFCIPGSVVEAVSGGDVMRLGLPPTTDQASGTENVLFTHLLTRWTIRPSPHNSLKPEGGALLVKERTEVDLDIKFQFANPIYTALSKAVAPKVAGMIIEAFEERARKLLDVQANKDTSPITVERT